MDPKITSLERAFELATSGRFKKLEPLLRTLASEGYDASQVEGRSLRTQINRLISASRDRSNPQDNTAAQ